MADTQIPLARTSDLNGVAQEATLQGIATDVGTIKSDVATVKSDVGTVKSDVATVKSDVADVKSDVLTVKTDVGTVKSDVASIKTDVAALKQQATTIGNVNYHKAVSAGASGVNLYIKDPADRIIVGVPAAYWERTVVVRKDSSAPASPTDGTVVLTNTVRDRYFDTPFLDTEGSLTSYYRTFTYATNGSVNESADGIFQAETEWNWTVGYTLDTANSDPATCITYIEDNADFDPVAMDFTNDTCGYGSWLSWIERIFKPAMLRRSGDIDYYLSPDNLALKEDGVSPSDIANLNYDGNAMLIVAPIFCKIEEQGSTVTARFSNQPHGIDWFNWTHLKADGTFHPFCGWPLFEGYIYNGNMRSIKGSFKPSSTTTQLAEYTAATDNGAGWYTTTHADEMMFRLLFPLLTRSLDANETIGQTYVNGASALQLNCGTMTDKGWFYGRHFDGTNNVTVGSKFLHMENMWAHRWRRACGIVFVNGQYWVKLTPSQADGSGVTGFVVSDAQADYQDKYLMGLSFMTTASASFITKMWMSARYAMLPRTANGGASNTFFTDASWSTSGVRCFRSGGRCVHGLRAGAFASDLNNLPSNSDWACGGSLSYHAS